MSELSYLYQSFLGGVGVACLAGPLGAVMVWRRLAYFGDTLAHSGLLGVTLSLAFQLNVTLGVCFIALCVAGLLWGLQNRFTLASDTVLGILSHTLLAMGLLALSFREDIRVDVLSFLYGDILGIGWEDVLLIYIGGLVALLILTAIWGSLLRITVQVELAQVEGVRVRQVQALYLFLLALVVAIAIKMVGVLLITALLIIPAASARHFSDSPEKMAIFASGLGIVAVLLGLSCSHYWDVPTGPAIVVSATGLFFLSSIKNKLFK